MGDPSGHFVEAHARALARAGERVVVLAPGPIGVSIEPSLEVRRLGGASLFGWPGAAARAKAAPWRLGAALPFAARFRRSVAGLGAIRRIVAHWIVPSAWPLLAGRAEPLEVWAHGADVRLLRAAPSPARERCVRALLDRGARFRFAAQALLDGLAASLPPTLGAEIADASVVEPAPLETPPASSLPDPRPRARGAPEGAYVVWVGRLVPEKRPEVAARAAERAGVPLVVVGDGPVRPARGVFSVGRLPRDAALSWIAHARALVSTSVEEGAPTAVREARALGVPVIATPAGDLAAWARTDPGIVIARDERAVADAIACVTR